MASKMYYMYGSMNSSKTANLLMVAYNYQQQGKRIICMKPSTDTRWSEGKIMSRVGIETDCIMVGGDEDLFDLIVKDVSENGELSCVLIDEAQFLKKAQVRQLAMVVDTFDVPVMCYGLKNTYIDGELFEGSAALLYYADSIEQIKTVCHYCNRKATMNIRVHDGVPMYEGENSIAVGDVKASESSDYYVQTCRKHYFNPPIKRKRGKAKNELGKKKN